MVEWFALTEGSHIPATAPLFLVPKGKEGVEWNVLTREAATLLMKGAAVEFDLQPKWVATHSIRISGATALLMEGVPPETVQIMGRWVSNAFIGYTVISPDINVLPCRICAESGFEAFEHRNKETSESWLKGQSVNLPLPPTNRGEKLNQLKLDIVNIDDMNVDGVNINDINKHKYR